MISDAARVKEDKQEETRRVVVVADIEGFPQQVLPVGVPVAALSTMLRLAAKMVDERLGI